MLFDTARNLGLTVRECRRTIASGMTAGMERRRIHVIGQ
jgi:hypothetical protein